MVTRGPVAADAELANRSPLKTVRIQEAMVERTKRAQARRIGVYDGRPTSRRRCRHASGLRRSYCDEPVARIIHGRKTHRSVNRLEPQGAASGAATFILRPGWRGRGRPRQPAPMSSDKTHGLDQHSHPIWAEPHRVLTLRPVQMSPDERLDSPGAAHLRVVPRVDVAVVLDVLASSE